VLSLSQPTTLTGTLIILDITKTESNHCFTIHCFKGNNDKRTVCKTSHLFFLLSHRKISKLLLALSCLPVPVFSQWRHESDVMANVFKARKPRFPIYGNLVPRAFSSFKMAVGETPGQCCQSGSESSFEFRHANTLKCLRFVWITVSDRRKQTGLNCRIPCHINCFLCRCLRGTQKLI